MPLRSKKRQSGFSLLEVLVAFVIAALVVGGALKVFAGGSRNVKLAGDYYEAVRIAEGRLAELGATIPIEAGEYSGSWEDYQWSVRVAPFTSGAEIGDPLALLFSVAVDVTWSTGAKPRTFSLATLRQGPPES